MKKIFLSAAALVAAVTIQAQDVKVTWLSGTADGTTVPALTSTSTHATIVGSDIEFGTGINTSANAVGKVTDKEGTNQNTVGGNFLAVKNSCENVKGSYPSTFDEAQSYDTKLSFKLTAPDPEVFYFQNLSMDLCGAGTDAVRVQVVLKSSGDEDKEVAVITKDNCHDFAADGGWFSNGWRPSRNDGTKADKKEKKKELDEATGDSVDVTYTSIQSTAGYTHLVIPASAVADVAGVSYDFTVDVYFWGIASNKQFVIRNVVLEGSSTEPTGITAVTASEAASDAPAYNLAGQRVSKTTKGLYIQNGKKYVK